MDKGVVRHWIVFAFVCVVCVFCRTVLADNGIPDFSDEVREEDLSDETVLQLRYDNYDKPDRCRTDICLEETTVDPEQRGTFHWRCVQAGVRLYVRCPYSVDGLHYVIVTHASRDCQLNGTVANWSEPQVDHCPRPPFRELVDHLANDYNQRDISNKAYSARMPWFSDMTASVAENVERFLEQPIHNDDMIKYEKLLTAMADILTVRSVTLSSNTIQTFMNNLEYMSRRGLWSQYSQFKKSLPRCLAALSHKLESGSNISSENIYLSAHVMPMGESLYATHLPHSLGGATVTVQSDTNHEQVILYVAALTVSSVTRGRQGTFRPTIVHMHQSFTAYGMLEPLVYVAAVTSSGVWSSPLISYPHPVTEDQLVNSLINNGLELDSVSTPNQTCEALNVTSLKDLSTVNLEAFSVWQSCTPVYHTNHLQCICQGAGFFATFEKDRSGLLSVRNKGDQTVTPKQEISTLEVFLGFPFHYPLYVLGHILRAVSFLCLTLTLVSYLVLSKTRKGVPTRILLHLCFTLILLNIVLYIAEATASSRNGCRVSNVLRYYFIMVSLMWNGIEAVNMYLMLVQVIGSDTRRFVRKAALVAYGVPAVAVGIALAVRWRAFDGMYDLHCDFVCRLSTKMLYFGYLLPLCLIMLHNIIVFILVCRVLMKQQQSTDTKHHAQSRRRFWVRLSAAVSLLVLLGVPWIFSAFGAIDNSHNNVTLASVQGVIQIVFIIFINLQGVFIFSFHCARRAEIRQSWQSVVTSTRKTSLSSINSLRNRRSSYLSDSRSSKRFSRSVSTTDELKVALNTVSTSRPNSSVISDEKKPLNSQLTEMADISKNKASNK